MAFGFDDAINAGLKIIDKFIPDPAAKAVAEKELRGDLKDWDKAQSEVNKVEAAHTSIFVAGWRPFVGWTCGGAFALHFVIFPVLNFFMVLFSQSQVIISFDVQTLMTVLMGMLGMGGLRTYEKIKNVARTSIGDN
jgi:hypothetical protein